MSEMREYFSMDGTIDSCTYMMKLTKYCRTLSWQMKDIIDVRVNIQMLRG